MRSRPAPALVVAAVVWWLTGAPAVAQSIDVAASLDVTNGLARPGAYVPVTLKATNRTAEAVREVRISSGGPIEAAAAWPMAPGETSEIVLPVYCTAGELALKLDFLSVNGDRVASAKTAVHQVQAAPEGTAVIAVGPAFEKTEEAGREALRKALGVRHLHLLQLSSPEVDLAARCGLLDAVVTDSTPMQRGRAAIIDAKSLRPALEVPLPAGALEAVQPEAYALLGAKVWPAEDRLRLWLGLGIFALSVAVVGALLHRRRKTAAVALAALAAGACVGIWLFGGVHGSRVRQARVFHVRLPASQAEGIGPAAALEHLVLLESRGGEPARYVVPVPVTRELTAAGERETYLPEDAPLPLPLLASSEDLFRAQGFLHCGRCGLLRRDRSRPAADRRAASDTQNLSRQEQPESPAAANDSAATAFESQRPQSAIRILTGEAPPFGYVPAAVARAELDHLAKRSDLVAAILVDTDRATDSAGRTQPLDAWAVEWQAGPDHALSFAGRSLAWWKKDRQEGEGPWLLTWWHDPLAADEQGKGRERLPALVAYTAAPPGQTPAAAPGKTASQAAHVPPP
jgi:hypothetical protein